MEHCKPLMVADEKLISATVILNPFMCHENVKLRERWIVRSQNNHSCNPVTYWVQGIERHWTFLTVYPHEILRVVEGSHE